MILHLQQKQLTAKVATLKEHIRLQFEVPIHKKVHGTQRCLLCGNTDHTSRQCQWLNMAKYMQEKRIHLPFGEKIPGGEHWKLIADLSKAW